MYKIDRKGGGTYRVYRTDPIIVQMSQKIVQMSKEKAFK